MEMELKPPSYEPIANLEAKRAKARDQLASLQSQDNAANRNILTPKHQLESEIAYYDRQLMDERQKYAKAQAEYQEKLEEQREESKKKQREVDDLKKDIEAATVSKRKQYSEPEFI